MSLVRIIKPDGYPHWRCFEDVAKSIELSLPEGWTRPIIFGANLLKWGDEPLPHDAIVFNMESWSSPWMTPEYVGIMQMFPVLDYAEENVRWLRERGVDAHYCPIRYHPHLTRLTLSPEPDLDCLFYGSLNMGRRPEILKAIEATGLKCLWLDHNEWHLRDEMICRSKIVLNLHAYPNAPLEMARISYLLANGALVISEGPQDMKMRECMVFDSAERIPLRCAEWIADNRRADFGRFHKTRFMKMAKQDRVLKTALAELQVAA